MNCKLWSAFRGDLFANTLRWFEIVSRTFLGRYELQTRTGFVRTIRFKPRKFETGMKTENTIIIHPETIEQENALKAFAKALKIKFEVAKENPYKAEFVAKVQESRKQAKDGKVTRVEKENLKEFLGL